MSKEKVGDIIVSYDFPNRTDCYMVGKIISIDESSGLLCCETYKQVSEGVARSMADRSQQFKTPMNGLGMFDDKYPRIVILESSK